MSHILSLIVPSDETASVGRAVDSINASLNTDKVELMELDLASFDKVRSFVKEWRSKNQPLHILVNNAGMPESHMNPKPKVPSTLDPKYIVM